ncbi:hypothetical protein L1987_46610 [Smallanthus sonchifolius]|uniref:Uncharacterized protein n=1 Tax=Smallanthus sonchifolius TaxID=185202 RepID=A0ACB9G0C0_9ASTR|nr:hypothetical protein L1987_46610 [Smallanthus sonchifolius]
MSNNEHSGPPSGYYQRSDSMEDTKTGVYEAEEPAPTFPTKGKTSLTADGQHAVQDASRDTSQQSGAYTADPSVDSQDDQLGEDECYLFDDFET